MSNLFEPIGQVVVGFLFADFFTGVCHWWEDRVGDVSMPLIGKWIVVPNRLHHTDPLAFTRSPLVLRNHIIWAGTMLIFIVSYALWGVSWFLITITAFGLLVGEVHVWSHLPQRGNAFVRMIQETGLIQSPRHHWRHHQSPDGAYCTLTNLLNPILDYIHFWAGLERALRVVGLPPNEGAP